MDEHTKALLTRLLAEWDRTLSRQQAIRNQLENMLTKEIPALSDEDIQAITERIMRL